eukprot:2062779-Amphidinium_carterae.1
MYRSTCGRCIGQPHAKTLHHPVHQKEDIQNESLVSWLAIDTERKDSQETLWFAIFEVKRGTARPHKFVLCSPSHGCH